MDSLSVGVAFPECLEGGDGLCKIYGSVIFFLSGTRVLSRTFSEPELGVNTSKVLHSIRQTVVLQVLGDERTTAAAAVLEAMTVHSLILEVSATANIPYTI